MSAITPIQAICVGQERPAGDYRPRPARGPLGTWTFSAKPAEAYRESTATVDFGGFGFGVPHHQLSVKTKEDLEALLSSKPDIKVIHHSLNGHYEPATATEIETARAACGLNAGDEYLLHVGGNQWYKNRLGALQIALELRRYERFRRVKLVMAGAPWPEAMQALRREHVFGDAIDVVSPSNEQMRVLYSGALALLFPSLAEGFGWPVLEAQACGCLVITSDRASMTEIAGRGAILIDPENAAVAAQVIDSRIGEAEILKLAGWENLKRFTMDDVMRRYNDVYESVIADSVRRATEHSGSSGASASGC
jgi:glycosyltransferase involved in cell wall biosynthesis